ncbi:hypothetical protein [Streptomyces rhizosphaericus]|uniref:hypothetical protein n=1 Tax=Streptomyces rhizosphaericus TaxID=114699 RepID=UPI000A3B6E81|nr:hypothetical protein [Streptomyces rhizosphaericus]
MRTYDGYEMASTESIADLAAAFVDAVLEHPSLPLEQALSSISARLPESIGTQVVAFRQQQWLLMHWLAGVYEWAPDGTAQEAVRWVREHAGAQAASACLAHSGVLGHPGASLERVLQDWNQLDRIAAWVRLLAAVVATRGDGTAQWLRQFDPPEPADQGTVAWLVGCEPPGWQPRAWPPDPRQLPEIRRKQYAFVSHPLTRVETSEFLADGGIELGPAPVGSSASGELFCEQEADRLANARLYFVDADTCNVALRKGARPRTTPLSAHRVPSTKGLMFFAEPLPFTAMGLEVVAASWGSWDPHTNPSGWLTSHLPTTPSATTTFEPVEFGPGPHWWVTMYYNQDDLIDDGRDTPPMDRGGTYVLSSGQSFPDPATADSPPMLRAARVLIACWDLITQERVAKAVTESVEIPRKPAKTRADRRRGIQDSGTVQLVTVRGRPAQGTGQPQGDIPAQRTDGQYRHRWTVQEHTRSHCMNTHGHAAGDCTHEDITICEFVKGPPGAPFLRRDIVHMLRRIDK